MPHSCLRTPPSTPAPPPAPNATPRSTPNGPNRATAVWCSLPPNPASKAISPSERSSSAARPTPCASATGSTTSPNPPSPAKPEEHRVDYTLGNRRIQHYLTTLPTAASSCSRPTWDVHRSSGSTTSRSPIPTRPAKCSSRSGTRTVSAATSAGSRRATTIAGTNTRPRGRISAPTASAVTGPAATTSLTTAPPFRPRAPPATSCGRPASIATRNSMVCAQCHSFRDVYALGYTAGDDYYDYFLPILESTQPVDRGSRLLARRPHAPLLERRLRPVAERVLPEGRPRPAPPAHRGARNRDRTQSAAASRRTTAVHALPPGARRVAHRPHATTPGPAAAVRASSATCRAPCRASRPKSAIIPCPCPCPRTPSATASPTPAISATRTRTPVGPLKK